MLAVWGSVVLAGKTLTYEQYCSLYWNRSRVYYQRAAAVACGVGSANTQSDLPLELFDAIVDSTSAAEELKFQVNEGRRLARIKAKHGVE